MGVFCTTGPNTISHGVFSKLFYGLAWLNISGIFSSSVVLQYKKNPAAAGNVRKTIINS
jgi:hypothetical protein